MGSWILGYYVGNHGIGGQILGYYVGNGLFYHGLIYIYVVGGPDFSGITWKMSCFTVISWGGVMISRVLRGKSWYRGCRDTMKMG